MYNLYTINNIFIKEQPRYPVGFTGIVENKSTKSKEWNVNGLRHRTDGPACIYPNRACVWVFNDKLHRIGGPAIEHVDGTKEWFLYGEKHTETQYNLFVNLLCDLMKLKGLL